MSLNTAPTSNADKIIRLLMNLREKGITDTRVLGAIEKIPRELFIPQEMRDQAYEDIALPIGRGQTISQPVVVGLMTQALQIGDRDKVLEIGTGSGYQAAVLSKLCRRLYTIERHKPLLIGAHALFEALSLRNITAICADGMKGWPVINGNSQAPFQRIIVTAAARGNPPQELLDQLDIDGIMVCPVGNSTDDQVLKKYVKLSDDTFSISDICPVRFVPLLPHIARDSEERD
ncbi:MAG: protein-L-isoaspartate(D-aspartate) O-methyltransferase [Rhodospirillales bacterium]|nr:protein-L-isoaspartate(D-aspartate) O-methyltransferase [Rhodospirillales bacterium]MCB9964576.1 protein-L-isoaspartate(D-aspartate) O-methyltransferase [Rhodospirillales bacterium]MCB9973901.1 protein-L-isoaspartate(D-aspartate) O-methyltransferase [Rhodospirillales bacterium]MCB9980526.1 protein-L-isoaspartate(D-aspartate) O-methyltransferase [Rhodospirillales bacterium]